MKIAFATKDNIAIDDHFGRCRQFAVYEINPSDFKLYELRGVEADLKSISIDETDRIDKRIELIKDCTILYCNDIGPMAAARVIRQRIHPIKVLEGEPIHEALNKLAGVLKNPPIWLRKILERET